MLTVKRYTEIKNLLGYQNCADIPKEIYDFAKAQSSLFDVVIYVYLYAYIMGQRAERARRKRGAHNG